MNASSWIALGIGVISLVLNMSALFIGYGVLKGTVQAMGARIAALEGEMGTLTDLKIGVAELKTSMAFMAEQLKDLNASIRWMREPAPADLPRGVK